MFRERACLSFFAFAITADADAQLPMPKPVCADEGRDARLTVSIEARFDCPKRIDAKLSVPSRVRRICFERD